MIQLGRRRERNGMDIYVYIVGDGEIVTESRRLED
jgi:hypothetical protein